METVDRLVWLYYIAACFTLILGIWLGQVFTLAGIRFWVENHWRERE